MNKRLKAEVDVLQKFKVKLETVQQNDVARSNIRDNTNFGCFINLLHDTNSANIPVEWSRLVPTRSNSLTDTMHPCTRTGHVPSSLTEETHFKNIGDDL